MISLLRIGFLSVAFAVLLPATASAVTQLQIDQCANKSKAYSPDQRIDGCSAAIESGRWSGKGLAWAYANRAHGYLDNGHYDLSIADSDEAIRLDPTSAVAYANRSGAYLNKGDNAHAIADSNEAIRLDPTSAVGYANRGGAYLNTGDTARAIADSNEAIRLDPKLATAWSNRGEAYRRTGDNERAIADLDEAVRLDPKLFFAYASRGLLYSNKGDYDRAIADLNEAIRLDPQRAFAYVNRANAYRRKGDYDHAIADNNEAIRLDPKNAGAYADRGTAYGLMGDNDRAIADLDEAIRLDPNKAFAYSMRGNVHAVKGDYDRALADFNEAMRLDPKLSGAYNGRGNVYRAKGDSDRAIADYDEAIRFDPNNSIAYSNRGKVYHVKGNFDRAIADYSEAIRLDPANPAYLNGRCWDRALAGRDLPDALADCNESLRLHPGDPNVLNSRGFVQLRLGAFDKAIEDYDAAIAKNARDGDSLYGRGIAKTKSGDATGGTADIAAAKAIKADIADAHAWSTPADTGAGAPSASARVRAWLGDRMHHMTDRIADGLHNVASPKAAPQEAPQVAADGPGARAWFGVATLPQITEEMASNLHIDLRRGGALVFSVVADSPAQLAGLAQSDLIVRFDTHDIKEDAELSRVIAEDTPGKTVDVVVIRNGREQTFRVTLGRRDAPPASPAEQPRPQVAAVQPPIKSDIPPKMQGNEVTATAAGEYINRGNADLSRGDYDGAIAEYNAALKINSGLDAAYGGLGQAYQAKKDYIRAISEFDSALNIRGGNADYLLGRCRSDAAAGRNLPQAQQDCAEAIRLSPGNAAAFNARGLVNLRLGAYGNAVADYNAAIASNSWDADSLYGRGLAKMMLGDIGGGNADIAGAKSIRPDVAFTHPWGDGVRRFDANP